MILIVTLAGLLIYLPGMNIKRHGDDIQLILDSPPSDPFYFFYNQHPSNWYRPLEFNYEAMTQRIFGPTTIPIHVASIVSHLLLVYLVFSFTLRLGFKTKQALLAALFMTFSQANVHPVLSNDTLSQVWGALFGFMSIFFLYNHFNQDRPKSFGYYLLSIFSFALALSSKEGALAFLPILMLFSFFFFSRQGKSSTDKEKQVRPPAAWLNLKLIKEIAWLSLPYLLIIISFLVARTSFAAIQPSFGPGRYQFHIGPSILENMASLLFASLVPFSSVAAFVAIFTHDYLKLGIMVGITAVFTGLIVWGIYLLQNRKLIYLMIGSAFLAYLPTALLNHVSELHVYNALPFVSIVVGIALGRLWEINDSQRWARMLLKIFIVSLLLINIVAVQSKTALMQKNGELMTSILEQLKTATKEIPQGAVVYLANPAQRTVEYSVFLVRGFNILENTYDVRRLIDRQDLSITIVEEADLAQMQKNAIIFTIDNMGTIHRK